MSGKYSVELKFEVLIEADFFTAYFDKVGVGTEGSALEERHTERESDS